MRTLAAFLCGLIFGLGLVLSGMSNPMKVLNFLDISGLWDPSLILVMAGAVVVTFLGYRLVLRRPKPFLAEGFQLPSARHVDARLIGGASLFGIGWGIGGFCPGPALTGLALLNPATLAFVAAMFAGMAFANIAKARLQR